jgi:hypothetical protein
MKEKKNNEREKRKVIMKVQPMSNIIITIKWKKKKKM